VCGKCAAVLVLRTFLTHPSHKLMIMLIVS
jgi:hypothetical protein